MLKNYSEILTPQDLMKILKLSKNTVYSMLNNRIVPAYRVGNSKLWRINKCDFEDYLKSFDSYW